MADSQFNPVCNKVSIWAGPFDCRRVSSADMGRGYTVHVINADVIRIDKRVLVGGPMQADIRVC